MPTRRPPSHARAIARQATSYMAAPPAVPVAPDDPLLDFAPVPHVAPRRNSITPARQRAFIAALAATGIVSEAARGIGASMEALYNLRLRPGEEEFRAAWERAVDCGIARLEDGALTRAIQGEERLVVAAGQVLGSETRHNEALVMFFLKHRRAQRYGGDIRPGHPLYERIRAEVLAGLHAEAEANREPVLERINAKLALMQAREAEVAAMLAGDAVADDGADDGADAGAAQ